MKSLFTGIALLAGLSAGAQQNRLSLGMTYFGQQKQSITDQATYEMKQEADVLRYLPTIGYYRMLNKSFGIGAELGYGRSRESITETAPGFSFRQTVQTDVKYSEFYVCPNLFEVFKPANRNYQFVASLSLPLSLSQDISRESVFTYPDFNNGQMTVLTEPTATRLGLGLFVSGSIQRRIVGNLFICPQLGIGATYTRFNVEGTQVIVDQVGAPRRTERQINETQTNYDLVFRPGLALNYYF